MTTQVVYTQTTREFDSMALVELYDCSLKHERISNNAWGRKLAIAITFIFLSCQQAFGGDGLSYVSEVSYRTQDAWKSGFQAQLEITVARDIPSGWKFILFFNQPIAGLQCWSGEVRSAIITTTSSEFTIIDKGYNAQLSKGQEFSLGFIGEFPANGPEKPELPAVRIEFQGQGIYESAELVGLTNTPANRQRSTTDVSYIINRISASNLPTLPSTTSTIPTTTKHTAEWMGHGANNDKVNNNNDNNESSESENAAHAASNDDNSTSDRDNKNNASNIVVDDLICDDYVIVTNATVTNRNESYVEDELLGNSTYSTSTKETMRNNKRVCRISTTTTAPPNTSPMAPKGPNDYYKLPEVRTRYNYVHALHLSIMFYEAQRSGKLPLNSRIPWRFDSALGDRGHDGEDLTGGWYDAGDHVKFGFPMAFSLTLLSWGVIEFYDTYERSKELDMVMETLKWGADYLVKAHVAPDELYVQVGDPAVEHKTWNRPEEIPDNRPAYKLTRSKPGSDVAAETAASLAATSLAFRKYYNGSTPYVRELVEHAKQLANFSESYPGEYHISIPEARKTYKSTGYKDELVWAIAWLYRATGDLQLLDKAIGLYFNLGLFQNPKHLQFSWDDKTTGIQILLAQISHKNRDVHVKAIESYCNKVRTLKKGYTRLGLLFLEEWSPLRYAANAALVCLMAANEGINPVINRAWSRSQIHYMLGSKGRSYVIGFGANFPKRPHHRASSCPKRPRRCSFQALNTPKPNPHILYGALVGGPNKLDIYRDDRKSYEQSEVALDYNAGFQGAIAGLLHDALFPTSSLQPATSRDASMKWRASEPWYRNYVIVEPTEPSSHATTFSRHSSQMIRLMVSATSVSWFLHHANW